MPTMKVSGAASLGLRRRLEGARATGTVVHAGRHAIYARFGERVVGVSARGAVHVPATISTALSTLPEVGTGAPAELGGGLLHVGGLAVGVDRLVATQAPALGAPAAAGARLARALAGGAADLAVVRRQLPAEALALLARGRAASVPLLVGRGDGLTPVGDDVLAGWLVTARACGRDVDPIATGVAAGSKSTTTLSATLLSDAASGECLPEFRALLLALRAGRGVPGAVARLTSVGHTSGTGMLVGSALVLCPAAVEETGR